MRGAIGVQAHFGVACRCTMVGRLNSDRANRETLSNGADFLSGWIREACVNFTIVSS
jgi:hypothetical protein